MPNAWLIPSCVPLSFPENTDRETLIIAVLLFYGAFDFSFEEAP